MKHTSSTTRLRKGGDMMKRVLMLTIITLFVIGIGAVNAETVSTTLYPGLNLIGPPVVPFDPDPMSVFKNNTGANLDLSNLVRYDSVLKGYIGYDELFPEDYGNVLLGEGAWLTQGTTVTWQYDGAPNGLKDSNNVKTDMWISLPKAGLSLIGTPFNNSVLLADVQVTNGTQTISWDQAVNLQWVDSTIVGYNAVLRGYYDVGTDDILFDIVTLDPFHGYWVKSFQDNLALIIPAGKVTP